MRRPDTVWVAVAAISAVAVLVAAGVLLGPWLVSLGPGPSDFAPAGVERVPAGSIGCGPTTGEVCYAASLESLLQGLTLGHLRFVVANGSEGFSTHGPLAPPLPLGAGAQITALAAPAAVAGVWNMSDGQWVTGGDWRVPAGPNVVVVLDTGLLSNSTLEDAYFAIVLTSPYEGSIGFPLG